MGHLKKLGKYTIQSILGQGAMGIVYKGFDPHIERTVAIKTIRKDALSTQEMEPLLARFKREAQAAGRLTHPGIVTVYEYDEEGDTAFIAMEYVRGRELKDFLDKNERFPLNTVISITTQLLDALTYSHAQGVVHRDIKPGNIILLSNGQIKVMDFGIARIESSTLTQFGDVFGTPSYMSPEQFSGQPVDKRSDLFSTGVILYHLLTGEKPFPGNSMTTIMHRVINTEAPLVSELNFQVPSFLDEVVLKALTKKPDQRFQTAEEFKAALTKVPLTGETLLEDLPRKTNAELREMCGAAGITGVSKKTKDQLIAVLKDVVTGGYPGPGKNLPSDEIAEATQLVGVTGNNVDLQEKFDKTVDLLESQGVGTKEAEQLYGKGRKWTLTILVVTILAIFSFTAWTIYSEDLTYQELEQIAKEKFEDFSASFSDQFITIAKEKFEDISASFSDRNSTIAKEKPKDIPASFSDQSTTIVKEKPKDFSASLSGQNTPIAKEKSENIPASFSDKHTTIVKEKSKDIPASFPAQNTTVVEISQSLKHKPAK